MTFTSTIRSLRATSQRKRVTALVAVAVLGAAIPALVVVRRNAGAAELTEIRQKRDELLQRLAELHDQLDASVDLEAQAKARVTSARLVLAIARDRYRVHVAALYANSAEEADTQEVVGEYLAAHRAMLSNDDVVLLQAARKKATELTVFQTALTRAESEQRYLAALQQQTTSTKDLIDWYRAILEGRIVTQEATAQAEASAKASAAKAATERAALESGRRKANDDLVAASTSQIAASSQATASAASDSTRSTSAASDSTSSTTQSSAADDGVVEVATEATTTSSAIRTTRLPRAFSTAAQRAFMAQFPFGPVSDVPAGLTRTGQVISGTASWYGADFDGRPTASGAIYDMDGYTVASKELPLGTVLLISRNGRSVLALVNDRGPYVAGRVLDLSRAIRNDLGIDGLGTVRAEVLAVAA